MYKSSSSMLISAYKLKETMIYIDLRLDLCQELSYTIGIGESQMPTKAELTQKIDDLHFWQKVSFATSYMLHLGQDT